MHVWRELHLVHLTVGAALMLHAGPQVGDSCISNGHVGWVRLADGERDPETLALATTAASALDTEPTHASVWTDSEHAVALLVKNIILWDEGAHVADVLDLPQLLAIEVLRFEVREAKATGAPKWTTIAVDDEWAVGASDPFLNREQHGTTLIPVVDGVPRTALRTLRKKTEICPLKPLNPKP